MKLRELFGIVGIPMDHTAGPQGLKKVTKDYMGKKRTFYEPKGKKFNEKKKKGDLYTDDNPKDTIKKLGYKPVGLGNKIMSKDFLTDKTQRDPISEQTNLKSLLCRIKPI